MYASTEQHSRERVRALAEELYRQRYQYLLRIATRNAANREDASEAVQFAFAAFIEKFQLDSGSPPLGWITFDAPAPVLGHRPAPTPRPPRRPGG